MEVTIRSRPAPASAPKIPAPKPFRFLDLPAELRNRMYALALPSYPSRQPITLHHFWLPNPTKLYQTRPFLALTQVNRLIRREFPPQTYHATCHPTIAFASWSKFLLAFPFAARNLDERVPRLLDALDARAQSPIDILPLMEIDWTQQPFTVFWPYQQAPMMLKAKDVTSRVVEWFSRRPDSARGFSSVCVVPGVGLVTVEVGMKGGWISEADFRARKEVVEGLAKGVGLGFAGVRLVCEWEGWRYEALGQRQGYRVSGVWTTGGRRLGADRFL